MILKSFISIFLWIALVVSPSVVFANVLTKTSHSTSINIKIVIPEHAENQQCTVGFENSLNGKYTPLQNSGCRYNSAKLLKTAYQEATKTINQTSQGFVTVVITAP